MNECCEKMTQVLEESDGPFYHPFLFGSGTLKAGTLAVRTYRLTPSKKSIAKAGRRTIFLAFCPFCGKKLGE